MAVQKARTAILYIPGGAFLTRAAGAFVTRAVESRHVAKIHKDLGRLGSVRCFGFQIFRPLGHQDRAVHGKSLTCSQGRM